MSVKPVAVGRRRLGPGRPVFIIAEAGVNHNGRLALALRLVDEAKKAGADAVKFQTFTAETLCLPGAPKAAYQKRAVPGRSQFEMLKKLELSRADFEKILRRCRRAGILFLSSPFDEASAAFLAGLGVPAFKIPSGELTNTPLLARSAGYGRPLLLSTGMADLREIREALRVARAAGNRRVVLFQCTSNYPTAPANAHLRVIPALAKAFGIPVGFSDHTEGIESALAAVALGACAVEKHFTLSRRLPGPDHAVSLEPKGLAALVRGIRVVERALGRAEKRPLPSELPVRRVARRSLVTSGPLARGERFSKDNVAVKRPGTGLAPGRLDWLLRRRAARALPAHRLIREADCA